jgi:hypothetical protein
MKLMLLLLINVTIVKALVYGKNSLKMNLRIEKDIFNVKKRKTYMIDTLHSMIMSYNPMHDVNDTMLVEDKLMVEKEHHHIH